MQPADVDDFEALKGVVCAVWWTGMAVYAGGPRLLEHLDIQSPQAITDFSAQAGEKGQAVIYLIRENSLSLPLPSPT